MQKRPPNQQETSGVPKGFKLLRTIRGHGAHIWEIIWSPDGKSLASCSGDHTIKLWNAKTGALLGSLTRHEGPVVELSWAPDSRRFMTTSKDAKIIFWDVKKQQTLHIVDLKNMVSHGFVSSVAWSPINNMVAFTVDYHQVTVLEIDSWSTKMTLNLDSGAIQNLVWISGGLQLAAGTSNGTICIWNIKERTTKFLPNGHHGSITSIAYSPNKDLLASASADETIKIWNMSTGALAAILEGHTNRVNCVRFSMRSPLLCSKSSDGTVRLWRLGKWDTVAVLSEPIDIPSAGLAFHPKTSMLATRGYRDHGIRIWGLNEKLLTQAEVRADSRCYVNARVVLTGDTGVGKSGLGLVMTGKDFEPTESTHSRRVWTLQNYDVELPNGIQETRETLLWDLAGQPGYRLIHQLHLSEATVALVLFDARSETEPFAGVRHWERALTHAHQVSGSVFVLRKYLVAARSDRGGIAVSPQRIAELVKRLDFTGYFETSAKEGIGIAELVQTINDAIDWKILPKVSSNLLFQSIKQYLFHEKATGRLISTIDDLFRSYMSSGNVPKDAENPKAEFITCIRLVEGRGLIRLLSFGNLVLLQPELLDAYASAMIDTAKREPDGLGSIREDAARAGDFFIPTDIRIKEKEEERLLCIATVEDLLRHELALRTEANDGTFLVFPSQFTRDWDDAPEPTGTVVTYFFEGPILNIYARLAVRLTYSGMFQRKDMWRNACTFNPTGGFGTCGIYLRHFDEGLGELSLFYDNATSDDVQIQFEEYVAAHLMRIALSNKVRYERIVRCIKCGDPIPPRAIQVRVDSGLNWVTCPTCDNRIPLETVNDIEAARRAKFVATMDHSADITRDRAVAASVLEGKRQTKDYDVFICYHSIDQKQIIRVANQLKQRGILPWLDVWELQPGLPWLKALESMIEKIKSTAVFIGKQKLTDIQIRTLKQIEQDSRIKKREYTRIKREFENQNLSLGPWQDAEKDAILRQFIKRGCPVIPVILDSVNNTPRLPLFLEGMTVVDFRKQDPNPFEHLVWGITGIRVNL